MPSPAVGDQAPPFTAPVVTETGIEKGSLESFLGDQPVLLAFFPGAFTGTCTSELATLSTRFAEEPVTVLGISCDLPFALEEFRDVESLTVALASDATGEIVDAYDLATAFEDIGLAKLAQRAVFLLDGTGTVTYRWISETPGQEPPYDEIAAAL